MDAPTPVPAGGRTIAAAINRHYLGDEEHLVRELADAARLPPAQRERVAALAQRLVEGVRNFQAKPRGVIARIAGRLGEPVLRGAFRQAMRIMGHQFVMGRNIAEALERSASDEHRLYRHSFDMLGEAALTMADAERYLAAYHQAIREVAASVASGASIESVPSISVKLSALFPRYEFTQRERVLDELAPRLHELAVAARDGNIPLTVDAEEAERLELSLELIDRAGRSGRPQVRIPATARHG